MRAFGLRVRAGAPRRSQASSDRARLRRTSSWPARPRLALGPRLEVPGVAALVHVAAPAIELEDPGRHPVEHVTVVGDEDEPAAVRGEALLQPHDGVDVEVVGRLVEDQQDIVAGLAGRPDLQQRPGQRHPLRLAARQRGRRRRRAGHRGRAGRGSRPPPIRHRVTSPIVAPASGASWSSITTRRPRPRRTTPASGSTRPASWRSSVDLPEPLSPTTPSRSPDAIVTDTSANSGRPGRLAASPAASRRITTLRPWCCAGTRSLTPAG